jgi:hypothetical protein
VPTDGDLGLIEGAGRIALIAIERQRAQATLAKAHYELESERDRLRLLLEAKMHWSRISICEAFSRVWPQA